MGNDDLIRLKASGSVSAKRLTLAYWIESSPIQCLITGVIIFNAIILGLGTSAIIVQKYGDLLRFFDRSCLLIFLIELSIRIYAYRKLFWKSGWNLFDFIVVGIALVPSIGPWSILRSLRILRIFRLMTIVPQLRRVVAAFLDAIPGLVGVILVMCIFFYTTGVLATTLFGSAFPEWFGTLGKSLYSLFQIMTLESWSMGIVRPVMKVYPWAWAFFVPFIVIATFTILNLFIGIIVSTMQELSTLPDLSKSQKELLDSIEHIENELSSLKEKLIKDEKISSSLEADSFL